MLQSLISLEDNQIDLVLDAVRRWCEEKSIEIDSDEGRHAINAAVNIVSNRHVVDLYAELVNTLD